MVASTPSWEPPSGRMPALFLSHGGVKLAEDPEWTRALADLGARLPVPASILVMSAHWEEAPLTVGATTTSPLVYDLTSLPREIWPVVRGDGAVAYPAPGALDLATEVVTLLGAVHHDPDRGLDHGAFMPLREMYPKADVPVLQISLPSLDPGALLETGRRLAPLRDRGTLIIGSGFTTHNLDGIDLAKGMSAPPPQWSVEFDDWAQQRVEAGDVDALLEFERAAPAARLAHPRAEHFAPLFMALGAALDRLETTSVVDGFWYGLSRRSFQFH